MSAKEIVKSAELRALFLKQFSDAETRALADFLYAVAEFEALDELPLRQTKAKEIASSFSNSIKSLDSNLLPSKAELEASNKGIFEAAVKAVSTDLENAQLAVFKESAVYQDWSKADVPDSKGSLKSKISTFELFSSPSSSPSTRRPISSKMPRKSAPKASSAVSASLDEIPTLSQRASSSKSEFSSSTPKPLSLSANAEVASSTTKPETLEPLPPLLPAATLPSLTSNTPQPIAFVKPPAALPEENSQIPVSSSAQTQIISTLVPKDEPSPPKANTVARPPPPSIPQLAPLPPLSPVDASFSPRSPLSPTPPNVLKGIALVSNSELSQFDGMHKLFIELDSSSLAFYSDQYKSDLESVIQFNLSSWAVSSQSSEFFSNLIQMRSNDKDVINIALPNSQPISIWFHELRRRCEQAQEAHAPRLLTRAFSVSKLSGINGFIPIFGVSQFRGRDRFLRDSANSHMSNEGGLLMLLSGVDAPTVNAAGQFTKNFPKLFFENEFLDSNASRAFSEAITASASRFGSLQGINGLAVAIRSEEVLSWRIGVGCSAYLCCDAARTVVPLFDNALNSNEVLAVNLDGRKVELVIVASNGVWKVLQPIEAVKIARDAILAGLSSARAAEEVVKAAHKRKSKESLTVQLVQIGALVTLSQAASKQVAYLQDALRERSFFIAFREFIYSHFTEENLIFYLNAVFFEMLPEEALLGFAEEMHRKFFAPNAPHLLNLDAAKRNELAAQYARVHRYMFRPTMNRILHVLRTEWYPQFLLSPGYIEYSQGTTTLIASKRSKSNETDILDVFKGIKKPLDLMPPSSSVVPWEVFLVRALAELRGSPQTGSQQTSSKSDTVSTKRKGLAASVETTAYEDDFDSGFTETKKPKTSKTDSKQKPSTVPYKSSRKPRNEPMAEVSADSALRSAVADVKYQENSSDDDTEVGPIADTVASLRTNPRIQGLKATKIGSKKMSFTNAPQTFGSLDNLLGSIRQLSVMLAGPIPQAQVVFERTTERGLSDKPRALDKVSDLRAASYSPLSRSSPNLSELSKSSINVRASVIPTKPFSFLCVGWSGVGRTAFANRLVAFKYYATKYIGEIEEVTPTFMFPLGPSMYPCVIHVPRIYATQSFSKTFAELSQTSPIDGIILCYDLTDRYSYTDFVMWAESGPVSKVPSILVGTHLDEAEASREVPSTRPKTWAKKRGIEDFEVSSVTGENVMESFSALLGAVFNANAKESKS